MAAASPPKQVVVLKGIPVTREEGPRPFFTIGGAAALLRQWISWCSSLGVHALLLVVLVLLFSSSGHGTEGPGGEATAGFSWGPEEAAVPVESPVETEAPEVEQEPAAEPEVVDAAETTPATATTGPEQGAAAQATGQEGEPGGGTSGGGGFYGLGLQGARVVFILDRSGSMRERNRDGRRRMDELKQQMVRVLDELPDGTRLGIVGFDESVDAFSDGLVELNPGTRRAARRFLDSIGPRANTNIHVAVDWVLDRYTGHGQGLTVYLYSDGEPNRGPTMGGSAGPAPFEREIVALQGRIGEIADDLERIARRRAGWQEMRDAFAQQVDNREGAERALARIERWEREADAEEQRLTDEQGRLEEQRRDYERRQEDAMSGSEAAALVSCGEPRCASDPFWTAIHARARDQEEVIWYAVFEGESDCAVHHMRRLAESSGGAFVNVRP